MVHTYFWGDRHHDIFLGHDRAERISPLRSALKRGIPFSNHNDTFVTPIDPLLSVWSAVNRRTSGGRVLGENQTIPVMEALRSVTSWAAYQACEEHLKGSLEPGKLADMVVLADNPLTVAKETIKDIGIVATIVGELKTCVVWQYSADGRQGNHQGHRHRRDDRRGRDRLRFARISLSL